MNVIIYNDEEYRQFRDTLYYVSKSGFVYSLFSKRILKPCIMKSGHQRIDIYKDGKCKHFMVHRMVYECWVGKISDDKQINHYDDDKKKNNIENLYEGTQKENIQDCIRNGHRKGNIKELVVEDKNTGEILTFSPAINFFEYSGHPCASGYIQRAFTRNWFKENYKLLRFDKGQTTIENAA